MDLPVVAVARADFSIEDPWSAPREAARIALVRSTDGAAPRQPTALTIYADAQCLNVLFDARDESIVATYLGHDEPLYREDVVEIFLAPNGTRQYFEIEVNPLGTTFDARIDSPDGIRATMKTDLAWDCANLFAAIRKTPGRVETIVRIPFASLGAARPRPGEEWRGNFFRIDRDKSGGDEYSAWSATLKDPPDFHVPAAFGRIVFA